MNREERSGLEPLAPEHALMNVVNLNPREPLKSAKLGKQPGAGGLRDTGVKGGVLHQSGDPK
eukprot:8931607-Pyramimonas_sp.AAC.1